MASAYWEDDPAHQVLVEVARPGDADAIVDVRRATWLATYPNAEHGITEQDIQAVLDGEDGNGRAKEIVRVCDRLNEPDHLPTFVAKVDGQVVGFCSLRLRDGQRQIGAIYVLPDFQGIGAGGQLLERAVAFWNDGQDAYLHVATYNQKAIGFYRRHGFRLTGKDATDPVGNLPSGAVIPEVEMVRGAA